MKIMPDGMAKAIRAFATKMASATQVISSGLTPLSPELIAWLGGASVSGKAVNDVSAMSLSSAWTCMRIISEAVGTIPWAIYRRQGQDVVRADDYLLAAVLNGSPNVDMTPVEFRETKTLNLTQSGNAYSLIDRLGENVTSLYPIKSRDVITKKKNGGNTKLNIPDGTMFYSILDRGKWTDYTRDLVWHVKGFGNDGVTGLSPIACARESMGFALATDDFGNRFFSQGGKPSGIVSVPTFFTEDQRKIARENLNQMMGGLGNAHRFALFEGGMKAEPWGSMPLKDMEFVMLKKFTVLEMCRIFRVPPHMAGEVERGASYASAEMMSSEFVMFTLLPYLTRFESSVTKWLIPAKDRATFFLRFDYEALLRADSKARGDWLASMVNNGLMSRNEGRVREGLNRSTTAGMDSYTVQGALLPIDKLGQDKTVPPPAVPEAPAKSGGGDTNVNASIVLPSVLKHEVEHAHPAIRELSEKIGQIAESVAQSHDAVVHMGQQQRGTHEAVVGMVRESVAKIAETVVNGQAALAQRLTDGQEELAATLNAGQEAVAAAVAKAANRKTKLTFDKDGNPIGSEPVES